jgi:sodium-dependent dicarboxylate transporter 2/3/5
VKDGTIAVLAALVLFVLPSRSGKGDRILTWEFVQKGLPWGSLLLFGGGFALAKSFDASGLSAYLAAAFRGLGGLPLWAVLALVAFGMTALSEVASNTAATSMMLPVLLSLARGIGTDPLPILLVGTLAASCGFALPIATMPNTIAFATGEVSVGRMGRAGLALDLVATAVMIVATILLAHVAF